MTRNLSSPIKRDIDSNDIVMKDRKEMLISHENTNKKVAHRPGSTKVSQQRWPIQAKKKVRMELLQLRKRGHMAKK